MASFALICDTEKTIESTYQTPPTRISEKELLTFKFENKALPKFTCHLWSNERIECYQLQESPIWRLHQLRFDRLSGEFVGTKEDGWLTDKGRVFTLWRGRCERTTSVRF